MDRATPDSNDTPGRRVLVLGASGTIGCATAQALLAEGYAVVALLRSANVAVEQALIGGVIRYGNVTDPASISRDGICGERFDAVISCLASRTGVPKDAWAIDHAANLNALEAAKAASIPHFILLSAICVQKPLLAFQHAKLAFEGALRESPLRWTIVRPTAFFKSLSGQVDRVKRGKAFLLFGNGALTACKPISDCDLGRYIVACIDDETRWNRILPIGGPGDAMTPRQQGDALFALTCRKPKFSHVPVRMLDVIIMVLDGLGKLVPALAAKAALARIGRYYATESMLVLDPVTGKYDADATPSTGSDTLFDHYARLISGEAAAERGDHAVF